MVSHHEIANVYMNTDNEQLALHAACDFNKGEVVAEFSATSTQTYPSYLTVQVDIHKHINLHPKFLECINHSCAPSVFFDTTSMKLIALMDIKNGQEFTFFYPSTEWSMKQPFTCHCGSEQCLQLISGAQYLDKQILKKYLFTQFITQQLQLKNQEM